MTGAPASASRSPAAEGGAHYGGLRAEGLRLIQAYAGRVWTDYNAHDPGVTTLEQVCYALTDLDYRARHPAADLIAAGPGAVPRLRPAWRALPAEPATVRDFRRLLLDRVPGLGNAWMSPRPADPDGLQQGLYDLHLQPVADGGDASGEALRHAAAAVFLRHRPLCEDLHRLVVLRPLRVVIAARLVIRRGAEAERVVSDVADWLSRLLAPEPARHGLPPIDDEPSRVFDGPLMRRGLISDADLDRPRPGWVAGGAGAPAEAAITAAGIADLARDHPDVVDVEGLDVWVEGHGLVGWADAVAVPEDRVLRLDAGFDGAAPPLEARFEGDGYLAPLRSARLARLLRHAAEARRRDHGLMDDYRARFPRVAGRARDLDGFASVAGGFPAAYGLGDAAERPETDGARQFRGYLAIFDAAMACVLARLAAPRRLLAGGRVDPAAAGRAVLEAVPPSLRAAGLAEADLPDGTAGEEAALDALLLMAGEDPAAPALDVAPSGRVAAKERLLRYAPLMARRRGRGVDYRERPTLRRMSGVELRARVVLSEMREGAPRLRLGLVERNLLRPRTPERARVERGLYRYPRGVSVVLHLTPALDAPVPRRALRDLLRDEVPVHVGLRVHAVDRLAWRHFKRLDRAWRAALRAGDAAEIDWAAVELRRALDAFPFEDVR